MTEFRTIKEIGGITFYQTGVKKPKFAAKSAIGIVFCDSQEDAIRRTVEWDFVKRAKMAEVHNLRKGS